MGFDTTTFLFFAQFCLPPATSLSSSRDSQMSLFPNHNTDPSLPDIIEGRKNGIKNPKKGPDEGDFFLEIFSSSFLPAPPSAGHNFPQKKQREKEIAAVKMRIS